MARMEDFEMNSEPSEFYVTETQAMLSAIINLVCPQCGGSMMEFTCRGKCRKNWRAEWQQAIAVSEQSAHENDRARGGLTAA